jgi:RNA polymerase sigma-70 factor (ECF subfamily)
VQAPASIDWGAFRRRCLSEARRYVGDGAEDVVQEALLRAWRHWDACSTPHAPLPWLLAITRREAWRWRARANGRPAPAAGDDDPFARLPDAGGWAGDETSVERLAVQAAFAELRAEERRLLRLRYGQDLTQQQIAERLAVPEGTVKVRLHRLRATLRRQLEP